MKKKLDRRENEKVWNALNEIKAVFIFSKEPITIHLLGGWVLKSHKEGVDELSLLQMFKKRIWAFRYIENTGAIKIMKLPKKDNQKGVFILKVNESKFDNFYKSCWKSYKSKATAYQQAVADEKKPEHTAKPKDFGIYVEEKGIGYLKVDGKNIKIGKIDTRRSTLTRYLWDRDHFGKLLTVDSVFEEIRIKKDNDNASLLNPSTNQSERKKLISTTFKEISRILTRQNIQKFQLTIQGRNCKVELKAVSTPKTS